MHTEALKLVKEYELDDGGFRFFSDWLDARKVTEAVADRALEIMTEKAHAD